MTALTLLARVAADGVTILRVGDQVAVRPSGVLSDARRAELIAGKPQVLAWLDPEIRWRGEAMSLQLPPWPAPVLSLLARPEVHAAVDECVSCGDPLDPMGLPPVPRRCRPCLQAAWLVLEDWLAASRESSITRCAQG